MADVIYVVAPGRNAWHSKEEKWYHEGEQIDLSHLDNEQIAAVLETGVVVEGTAKEQEQSHE